MPAPTSSARYRFGVFEADASSGELRRQGMRVRLHVQPFQVLLLLLERPGQVLTREEIAQELWPAGTFVDFEHGVNSAVNRLRDALGDRAKNARYVETLARRGYRFIAPVERLDRAEASGHRAEDPGGAPKPFTEDEEPQATRESAGHYIGALGSAAISPPDTPALRGGLLASPAELPHIAGRTATTLFLLLQCMYLAFYVGALANLPEIEELVQPLARAQAVFRLVLVSAALLIAVRVFLATAASFRAPGFASRFLRMWPMLLAADVLWSLAPFLLLHHISSGLALACMAPLVYAPFAQRSLVLMGAGGRGGNA